MRAKITLDRFGRMMKANPGVSFMIAFELLLVAIIGELWRGEAATADNIGVVAFILAVTGVGLQTVISIRAKPAPSS